MSKSLVVAAASAFAAGTLVASVVSAQTLQSPSFGQNSTDWFGVNACKGQSACRRQGWVRGLSSHTCQAEGGKSAFAGGA
jgi:hypothetical protein